MDRTEHPTFFLKAFDGERLEELAITRTPGELFELEDQIAATVALVRDGRPVPADGEDGRWAVALCMATGKSAAMGRPVPLANIF